MSVHRLFTMLPIILLDKNMTLADLEKKSGVAHATLFDIYSGKTSFKKCSIETAIKIATALEMDVKELYDKLTYKDLSDVIISRDFDLYRSNILHEYKSMRYDSFRKKYKKDPNVLFDNKEYDKSLYLVTLLDEICHNHNQKVDKEYNEIRQRKLDKLLVPSSIYIKLSLNKVDVAVLLKNASKTFLKKNILEVDIFNE